MNIVIAGISGFLGQRIKKHFKINKHKIFDYKKRIPKNIDLLINVAGPNSEYCKKYPKKSISQRIKINKKLLRIVKKNNVKTYIYVSTIHVYMMNKKLNEKSKLNENNAYAKSHIESERFISKMLEKVCDYKILRVANCFGYAENKNCNSWHLVINNIVKNIFLKKKIIIQSKQNFYRDFIGVNYLIFFINYIIKKRNNYKIINVTSNNTRSIKSVCNDINKIYIKKFKKKIDVKSNFKLHGINYKITSKLFSNKLKTKCQQLYSQELKELINYCYKNYTS